MFSALHTKIYQVQRTIHENILCSAYYTRKYENISCSAYYTRKYILFSVIYTKMYYVQHTIHENTKIYPVQRTIQKNIACLSDVCALFSPSTNVVGFHDSKGIFRIINNWLISIFVTDVCGFSWRYKHKALLTLPNEK